MWIKRFIVFHNKRHLKDMGEKEITDFSYNHIVVRKGKGDKDRITMLPESLKGPLQLQIARVKVHDEDLKQGFGSVSLPDALEKKYPNANKEFACSIRVEKVCGVHWIIYDVLPTRSG